jgi:hypothetical protein
MGFPAFKNLLVSLAGSGVRYLRINADQTTDELTAAQMRTALATNLLLVLPGGATTLYSGEHFVLGTQTSDIINIAGMTQPYAFFGVVVETTLIQDGATLLYTVPAGTGFMFFDDGITRSGASWAVTL